MNPISVASDSVPNQHGQKLAKIGIGQLSP